MSIRELGYMIFASPDRQGWRNFGEEILGLAATDGPEGSLYLKMDERDYRIAIVPGSEERLLAAGWGVADRKSYQSLRSTLESAGVSTTSGEPAQVKLRRVQEFFSFVDPAGNHHEVFWGPISDFKPFISPLGIAAFVTGSQGLGHVVLPALNIEEEMQFMTEVMGFGLSDILTMNFGGSPVKLYFLHCDNARQHSIALAGMPAPNGMVHFMLEVPTLKDVGMALDRVQKAGYPLVMTLGQHVNDDCISFYFLSPGGFIVEIGWQAVLKDWSRHTVFETTLPSHWGHKFVLNAPGNNAG